MARSLLMTGCINSPFSTVNATEYWNVVAGYTEKGTLAYLEMPIGKNANLSRLRIQLTANTVSLATEFDLLVNSSPIAMDISVPAGASGTFETTLSGGNVVAGNEIVLRSVPGAGSTGTFSLTYTSMIIDPSDSATITTSFFSTLHLSGRSFSTASTTSFFQLNGYFEAANTTENISQQEMRISGNFKRLNVNIATNARTTATSITLRKTAVSQALTVSIGNILTGIFEDLTNSVSVVANDLMNWAIITGTGAQTITVGRVNVEFENTGTTQMVLEHNQILPALARNLNHFFGLTGYSDKLSSMTTPFALDLPYGLTATKLGIRVTANSISSDSSVALQRNLSDTLLSLTIVTLTTGWFEDTGLSTIFKAEDVANFKVFAGAGSGSQTITIRSLSVHFDYIPPAVATEVSSADIANKFIIKV